MGARELGTTCVLLVLTLVSATVPAMSAGAAVKIVSQEPHRVEFRLASVAVVTDRDAHGRTTVRVPGYGQVREAGYPVLPRIAIPLAVPAGTVPRLEASVSGWEPRPDLRPDVWYPEPGEFDTATRPEPVADGVWPADPVRIAWTGKLRGHGVALVEVFPFRWSPQDRLVYASRAVTVSIDFEVTAPEGSRREATVLDRLDPFFEGFVEELVLNPSAVGAPVFARDSPVVEPSFEASASTDGLSIAPVKIEITADGLYQVTGADLTAAGVDLTGVDPRELALFNQGQPADVRIVGESDGVFDPADALIFYGEGLDTRYTGTNLYWLRTDPASASRMATRDVTPAGAPLATVFRNSFRREDSLLYTSNSPPAQSTEHWWWERLDTPANANYQSSSDVYRVTLQNLPTSGAAQARLRFNVQGRSNQNPKPDHNTVLRVNGTLVDDQLWSDISSFTHDVLFDPALLVEGQNVITLDQVQVPGVAFASLYSNWFSIEYDDTFVAESDRLAFTLGAGTFEVEVEGFTSSSVEGYDVSVPAHPVLLTGANVLPSAPTWTFQFQDSPAGNANYESVADVGRLAPDAVIVDTPSTLRDTSNGADLIVITHPDFADEVQPLIDQRTAEGLRTVLALVEDVMDEFAEGVYDPVAIRDFLQYAYLNWQPPAPAFVLLFGDASLDYRDYLGFGGNFVPTSLTPNLPSIGEVMTDNYFVRVDGADLLPDMYIGRVAVGTEAQADLAVGKIVSYSQTPPSATTSDAVALVADDGQGSFNGAFEAISDTLADLVPNTLTKHKIYARQYPNNDSIRNDIRSRIDGGVVFKSYLGHGAIGQWGSLNGESGSFWLESDLSSLSNGSDQTFVLAMNCINGYFGDFQRVSMGEQWLRIADGAIGGWTPSGLGLLGDYDLLSRELFRRVFQSNDSLIGRVVFETLIRGFIEFGVSQDNMDELILFGDPSTHLATDLDLDGLTDRDEVSAGSDPDDADGDDDGVLDPDEPSWDSDSDGDGRVNAFDYDSDDDGLPDGLELGVTSPTGSTDVSAGHYVTDQDPLTTTGPLLADTDGGGAPDGAEDRNVNGAVDVGESDPENAADDPVCASSVPPEVTNLRVERDGDDILLTWDDLVGADPCVLYRVYVAQDAGTPDSFSLFRYEATVTQPSWRQPGGAIDLSDYDYLVTATSLAQGEGPLKHYGR